LKKISEMLKNQRRHFDDSVVTHCMRLICDYVDEITRDAKPGQQGAVYASNGRATRGDILEYRLRYSDNTATPLTGIKLFDTVPPYTLFKRALCLTLPSRGIAACAVSQQPAVNAASGSLGWTMTDASSAPIGLQPLDIGSVSFCVQVQSN
jgi:hypothetical protein